MVIVLLIMMISVLGISIISMTNIGNMIASNQLTASRAFYIAEAGLSGRCVSRDECSCRSRPSDPAADGYCVTPCLDAYVAPAGTGLTNPTRALFYGTSLTSTTFLLLYIGSCRR